ncbi:MAG TPA: transporter substrate-binding domain-containing protein [Beijerinckiaceae bacterium]|jgi:polar amino acid transport system substrate-binding protein
MLSFLLAMLGAAPSARSQGVAIPNFWDGRARVDRPDPASLRPVRVLTDDDFPPLHFAGPDGVPTGFSVELARAACEILSLTCTIQARRFETLLDALAEGRGDLVAAGIPINADLRARFTATAPYFRIPARFAARRDKNQPQPTASALAGKNVAVVENTAHQAYLQSYFPQAAAKPFPELAGAVSALRRGEVDYVFADALGLALWIGGTEASDCCAFTGGAYLESRYFGEGVGFILRRDDEVLRRAFDYALQRLHEEGRYAELYLRFFPVGLF